MHLIMLRYMEMIAVEGYLFWFTVGKSICEFRPGDKVIRSEVLSVFPQFFMVTQEHKVGHCYVLQNSLHFIVPNSLCLSRLHNLCS